jgi:hypothetical protein
MSIEKPDKEPAKRPAKDRGGSIDLMEPLLISEGSPQRGALTDLALELGQKTAGFRRSLPESLLSSLADLVRSMNCYYSNLIEGHDTHPIDIERALKGDYSKDSKKRDLQLEAKAHITVQRWIDRGGLKGWAVTADAIREIHKRFCDQLPEDLLWVEDPGTKEKIEVVPGELRDRDVHVGRHMPVSAPAMPRFLKRFEEVYSKLGKTETISLVGMGVPLCCVCCHSRCAIGIGSTLSCCHHFSSSPHWCSSRWCVRHSGTVNSSLTLRPSARCWANLRWCASDGLRPQARQG